MSVGEDSNSTALYILFTLIFLACYLLCSAFLEQNHYPVHRSAVAIIVGIIAGLIMSLAAPNVYQDFAKIDEVIIFSVLFPPMIFAQGYTLHKNVLFKNVKYILFFGLIGTFVSFLVSWGLIYEANQLDLVRDTNDIDNFRSLSDWEILILSACLCSIDTTASEEVVCEYKYPRLYSVIFGQDIIKDTVTIVLFDSILALEERESPVKLVIYWYTFFQMLLNFIVLILGSVACGTVSALVATFLSKKMRFITRDKGVTETGFLFLIGFFTYIYTELIGFSGSISLLLYGILLNHYNVYNMSEESRQSSVNTFTLISNICQGSLFLVMGIMVWQGQWQSPESDDEKMTHSYIFFIVAMVIVCIARFVNVYVLGWIARKTTKGKFSICNEEMHVLFMGGLVRGAVPFVLFSSVSFTQDNRYVKNEGMVLKTTIIFIIIFTNVILNSIIPLIYKKVVVKRLKVAYRQIFGRLQIEAKKEGSGKKSRGKQCQQKYLKSWLILDYQMRKESIKQQKKRRMEEALSEAMSEEVDQEQEKVNNQSQKSEEENDNKTYLLN